MSGFMKQHEFERLWRERDQLDAEARARLDEEVGRNRHARSFSEGGDKIRDILLAMNDEKAPENFAYRMGIYAKNHLEPETSVASRPWFRLSAVTAGLASGALLMMLMIGGPESLTVPSFQGSGGHMAQPTQEVAPSALPVRASEDLASIADSSANAADSAGARTARNLPDFDLQRVSTAE